MENLEIKKMNLNDLDSIKDILISDFDDFWNYNVLKDELQSDNSTYLVAKINSNIVGFAGIKVVLDEADIMNVIVKKNFRNQGIGALLLDNIISHCSELEIKKINLEVSSDNLTAIHLYKKFGFEQVGNRKNYYSSEADAILMSLILT